MERKEATRGQEQQAFAAAIARDLVAVASPGVGRQTSGGEGEAPGRNRQGRHVLRLSEADEDGGERDRHHRRAKHQQQAHRVTRDSARTVPGRG